ncbi:MAG: hypothetical protein ACP5J5_02030, partial [Dissulfurimicrobium sp.]
GITIPTASSTGTFLIAIQDLQLFVLTTLQKSVAAPTAASGAWADTIPALLAHYILNFIMKTSIFRL